MCGRFTLRASASVVAEYFAIFEMPPFAPRFNIAPTQPAPVVRLTPATSTHGQTHGPTHGETHDDSCPTAREFAWLRWGLIPGWAQDPAVGDRMINARAETAAQKPAYRAAMRRRRCLVAADGFYEWQGSGRAKQPYFIHRPDDSLFAFAGLWEAWEGADHSAVESCTILTTEPNELMRPIHDRMPVILSPGDYQQWLDTDRSTPEQVAALLRPCPAEQMRADPVSTWVNSPTHDDPRCIEPQRSLFA